MNIYKESKIPHLQFSSVQFGRTFMSNSLQPREPQHTRLPLSFTISQRLLKLLCIELVMPPNHLILCCPLILLPSIFPSIRVFSSGLGLRIRWPKYWSSSISLSNKYTGLVSIKIDWFNLAFQGTLRSLLQHHMLKASILWHSAFFIVQLSHPCVTTGKIIALTLLASVGKVISAF